MSAELSSAAASGAGGWGAGPLPPAGWVYDASTAQTRWWDGARWTAHVLPQEAPGSVPVYGYGAKAKAPVTSENGPAKASLILIVVQLLGGLALGVVAALASAAGAPIWQLAGLLDVLGMIGLFMTIAAFVLAIVGTVIAVRRPTRKREAVFALVYTSISIAWTVWRLVSLTVLGS